MRRLALILSLAVLGACGDTSGVTVEDAAHVRVRGHLIALHGVDAPKSRGACAAESAAAARAQARLKALIDHAQDVCFMKTGMACLQFMTCEGFVRADGIDVGQTLIDEGLAHRKAPAAARFNWCADPV